MAKPYDEDTDFTGVRRVTSDAAYEKGGRTLESPSWGGVIPTAETTLIPAYSSRLKRLLTSDARLDNESISVTDQKDRAYKRESGCCGVLA